VLKALKVFKDLRDTKAGVQGEVGAQGEQGFQGFQGEQGFQGVQGTVGAQGEQGSQGFQGVQGEVGPVAGQNTQIVFNNQDNPAGSANLTFDLASNTFTTRNAQFNNNVSVSGLLTTRNIVPESNVTYDIGTSTNRFRDIYLSNNSIFLGNAIISSVDGNVSTNGIIANTVFIGQNNANLEALIGQTYDQANAAYAEANLKLNIAGGTITGSLVVQGNLEILGNSTTLNVETLLVEDNEIILNSNATGAPSLNASVTVNRGDQPDTFLRWNENTDKWGWSDNGTTFYSFDDVRTQAGGAYDQANTATTAAGNAYGQANAAYLQANNAYDKANAPITIKEVYAGNNTVVNTFSNINTIQFDADSGMAVVDESSNTVTIQLNSTFKNWQVNGVNQLVASGLDTVNLISGDNILISGNGNSVPQSVTFSVPLANTTNTQVLFNNNGVFGGDADLTFNTASNMLSTNKLAAANVQYKNTTGVIVAYQYYNDSENSIDTVFI